VDDLLTKLPLLNDVVQAAIVIFGIAVALYNLRHVLHDRVTRAFDSLLFFVVVAFFAELMATRATAALSTENWIRLVWIGVAMVPAAQFHLADALLTTTGDISGSRRLFVRVWYLTGVAFFSLALFSDLIVADLVPLGQPPRLSAGPLFPLFAAYYWLISGTSVYFVWRARQRCVTRTTRKRMTVILSSFLAAPLAVFPYLTLGGDANLTVSIAFCCSRSRAICS
jgi:phage-related holin